MLTGEVKNSPGDRDDHQQTLFTASKIQPPSQQEEVCGTNLNGCNGDCQSDAHQDGELLIS